MSARQMHDGTRRDTAAGSFPATATQRAGPCCPGEARWVAVAGLAVVGATAVGLRWAARPPAVRTITMGPGGWVSFKNAGRGRPRNAKRRPWWAVVLRARPMDGAGPRTS